MHAHRPRAFGLPRTGLSPGSACELLHIPLRGALHKSGRRGQTACNFFLTPPKKTLPRLQSVLHGAGKTHPVLFFFPFATNGTEEETLFPNHPKKKKAKAPFYQPRVRLSGGRAERLQIPGRAAAEAPRSSPWRLLAALQAFHRSIRAAGLTVQFFSPSLPPSCRAQCGAGGRKAVLKARRSPADQEIWAFAAAAAAAAAACLLPPHLAAAGPSLLLSSPCARLMRLKRGQGRRREVGPSGSSSCCGGGGFCRRGQWRGRGEPASPIPAACHRRKHDSWGGCVWVPILQRSANERRRGWARRWWGTKADPTLFSSPSLGGRGDHHPLQAEGERENSKMTFSSPLCVMQLWGCCATESSKALCCGLGPQPRWQVG